VLTEEERYVLGDLVVYELLRHGDPWKLREACPPKLPGPRLEDLQAMAKAKGGVE